MPISEEFHANLEALPNILRRKYTLLRDMDKSLQEIQRQNELRCEQEIDDMKRDIKSGNILPDSSLFKFSREALDEQKHAIRIADEKVALAMQAYDMVDTHIQQLDQFLKKFDEEQRHERDTVGAVGFSSVPNKNIKDGRSAETGSNRGRKKTRLATATASGAATPAAATAVATPSSSTTPMELDLPVDPNEPTYCFCNQVSYGEMVACDNPDCKIEWFHYGCVGLKEPPKGKWYCTDCIGTQRRRKSRQT